MAKNVLGSIYKTVKKINRELEKNARKRQALHNRLVKEQEREAIRAYKEALRVEREQEREAIRLLKTQGAEANRLARQKEKEARELAKLSEKERKDFLKNKKLTEQTYWQTGVEAHRQRSEHRLFLAQTTYKKIYN